VECARDADGSPIPVRPTVTVEEQPAQSDPRGRAER
jgi:hypothetical protein